MKELTEQEEIVLNAIKQFIKENHYSPTYGELTEITPFKSKSTISSILDELKMKKYITFDCGKARTIKVCGEKCENCEKAIEYIKQYQYLIVDKEAKEELIEILEGKR